jgi:hypothetical protein
MISKAFLAVRPKKMIEDTLRFSVPVSLRPQTLFGDELCTWQELIHTPGPVPTDIVVGLSWEQDFEDLDEQDVLKLIVTRKREETDEEYLTRITTEDANKKRDEELEEQRDRYEYERLKAKYNGK